MQVIAAHSGGLLAMDVSGGLMATAGLGTRQGHLVPDTIVKVPAAPPPSPRTHP